MESTTWIYIVAAAFALIFGPLTARSAERREKIYGGTPARVINLIVCMAFVPLLPTALTGIIVGHFHVAVPFVIALLLTALIGSMVFAMIEKPAREHLAPKRTVLSSWTQEDARRSGL